MADYETEVAFYQRYNFSATANIRPELVDLMNETIDGLYENHYDELYHENAFRRVKGKQLSLPNEILPKEMSDFILSMGRSYLCNSGLNDTLIDPAKINLEIHSIWTTDSEENDYNPIHSHYGLMSGVFYLKVPPQVLEVNEEGSFNFHHSDDGYVDINPLQSIRPKGYDMVVPEVGKFLIFPAWLKHSVTPFFGPGIRRAASFNIVCPEASEWTPTPMKEPFTRRNFEHSLKIDTAGGPDAKIQGDRDISNVGRRDTSDA
jgi:hypothetical protein